MPLRGAANNEYSDGNGDTTLFACATIHIAQDICCAYPSRPVGDRRSKRHSLPVRDQTTNQPNLVLQHNGYGSSSHCRSRSFYCKSLPHGAIRLKSSDACCGKRLYTCVARWTICHGCVRNLSLRCQFLRRFDRPSPIR